MPDYNEFQRPYQSLNTAPYRGALAGIGANDLVGGVIAGVLAATEIASKQLQTIADVFSRGQHDRSTMARIHNEIGQAAKRSTVASYRYRVSSFKRTPSYRIGDRLSGGVLQRALNSDNIYEASAEGIHFPNVTWLNSEAKHWARLNFGAGEAAGSAIYGNAKRKFSVTWDDVVIAQLGFTETKRPAFGIPPGFFVQGEAGRRGGRARSAGGAFYPTRQGPMRPTRGITPTNFLDAGLARIARELPLAYEDLFNEWWVQAQGKAGPLTGKARGRRPSGSHRVFTHY